MPEDTITTEAPEATTETPTAAEPEFSPDEYKALQAKYERAQKDLTKFRTRAEEVEAAQNAAEAERQKALPLEERLKALEAEREELTKRAAAESERATAAERLASLTGKVADPKAALKLLEDKHLKDDKIDVDRLLKDYPFLAPTGVTPTRGAGGTPRSGQLTPEDFRGKTQAWIEANLHRLTPTKE